MLDSLLHLDGEVRRHAEPRFLVEATLARLAVELGTADTTVQKVASPLAGKSPAVPGDGGTAGPPVPVQSSDQMVSTPLAGEVARSAGGGAQPGQTAESTPQPSLQAPSPASADVTGWSAVLEQLNRTVRAAYLDAQPEVEGSTLVLWFRYGFHHKKAQEQSAQLMPLVRAWLGDGVKVDFRLRESVAAPGPGPKTVVSPEDDPFVRDVVRRFDGRVTRVKEVSE